MWHPGWHLEPHSCWDVGTVGRSEGTWCKIGERGSQEGPWEHGARQGPQGTSMLGLAEILEASIQIRTKSCHESQKRNALKM